MQEETILLFVYGSLKKGCYNHYLLKDASYMGVDYLQGELYSFGKYPAMTLGNNIIMGELYAVSLPLHRRIQLMELRAGYFEIMTSSLTGNLVNCFMYPIEKIGTFKNVEQVPIIEGKQTWIEPSNL